MIHMIVYFSQQYWYHLFISNQWMKIILIELVDHLFAKINEIESMEVENVSIDFVLYQNASNEY